MEQVHNSLNSLEQLTRQSSKMNWEKYSFFHSEVFRGIHSFLTHAAIVSRLLWPGLPRRLQTETDGKYQERIRKVNKVQRAIQLRGELELQEDHPLRSRKLRDHLEHFDERLDYWAENSISKSIVQDMIGPENSIGGMTKTDRMRWFNPRDNSFIFRDETYSLNEIAVEVGKLFSTLATKEENLNKRLRS